MNEVVFTTFLLENRLIDGYKNRVCFINTEFNRDVSWIDNILRKKEQNVQEKEVKKKKQKPLLKRSKIN